MVTAVPLLKSVLDISMALPFLDTYQTMCFAPGRNGATPLGLDQKATTVRSGVRASTSGALIANQAPAKESHPIRQTH
jgi:hypothetical protein